MPHLRPFAAVHYARRADLDLTDLIAPPFDVLDEAGKASFQAKHPNNVVTLDLPHLPPKAAGPAEKYAQAAITFDAWLAGGILAQDARPAFYPYAQTFEHRGKAFHRRGFFCLVRLSPFGQRQVVPHEKTYAGAIEDRLALMQATRVQMSPIFGLYSDQRGEVVGALYRNLGKPEYRGKLNGVEHSLWTVTDSEIENQVIDLMGHRPVYIADGHHRYTTALEYQRLATEQNGGPLPPNHPANFCLFVLVATQDDGMLILPTHRIIGGLDWFDPAAFAEAVRENFDVNVVMASLVDVGEYADELLPKQDPHTFGLYDGRTQKLYQLKLKNLDVLKSLEPERSEAWRRLDVAILQRYLLDEILQPHFAGGKELTRTYTADASRVTAMADGKTNQLAILLQPTPLHALEELGKHGEVMPQKSTYFFPKLATGLVMNSLR